MKNNWLILLICLFFSLIVINDYFHRGFPYTHDGENHLVRFANYKVALREGQIPPRIAPNLNNRYGYPVLNYNYPLANIVSLPFSAIKLNYQLTFQLIVFSSLVMGGWGVYVWMSNLFDERTAKSKNHSNFQFWPLLLALGTYYSAHYLTNTIVFRGSIGEVMAYGLFPWLLAWVTKPSQQPVFILIWAAFFLSHNLMAFFGTLLLIVVAGHWLVTKHPKPRQLLSYLLIPVLGLGLSLWFWLPAVLELDLVAAGSSELISAAITHFPTLNQLLFAPLEYGFSYPGSIDSLAFSLGSVQWAILSLFGLLLWRPLTKKINVDVLSLYFIILLGLILLQLNLSQPIWQKLSFLQLLQFPWRLSFFISILVVPLAYFLVNKITRRVLQVLILLIIIELLILIGLKPADRFSRNNQDYEAYTQSTTTQNENTPHTFKYQLFADWQPNAKILQGSGTVTVGFWQGSKRQYTLTLDQPSIIVEPTANFLGWQTTVINKQTQNTQTTETKVEYLDNDQIQGRIAYQLPAGEYLVTTKFTQNTPARMAGNGLTLLSLVFSFCYVWYHQKYLRT